MSLVFWLAFALVVYHLLVYPALARALASTLRYRAPLRPEVSDAELPSVALIVPAHNEAAVIETKIRNIAALQYPAGKLVSKLCLDGCSDLTEALARRAMALLGTGSTISLVSDSVCRGKVGVLNEAIAKCDADIIALSDTSALLEPEAIAIAARWFSDPEVGVVCATYWPSAKATAGEQLYWVKQNRLKAAEAAIAAPMGAHGAFYLFRRTAWTPLPADVINDDFILPMRIVQQGFKMVYDDHVVARELETSGVGHEFRRRVRIGAGNLQQVIMLWRLADPRRPGLAFVFCSGKGLRALLPLLAAAAIVSSVGLALGGDPWHQALVVSAAFGGFIGFAISHFPRANVGRIAAAGYLVRGLTASFVGSMLLLLQRDGQLWRSSSAAKNIDSPKQQGAET